MRSHGCLKRTQTRTTPMNLTATMPVDMLSGTMPVDMLTRTMPVDMLTWKEGRLQVSTLDKELQQLENAERGRNDLP